MDHFINTTPATNPPEWIPNEGPSAQCCSGEQNKTEFDTEAKENFILGSKYGEIQACALEITLPAHPSSASGLLHRTLVCRGAGSGLPSLACCSQFHPPLALQCLVQLLHVACWAWISVQLFHMRNSGLKWSVQGPLHTTPMRKWLYTQHKEGKKKC